MVNDRFTGEGVLTWREFDDKPGTFYIVDEVTGEIPEEIDDTAFQMELDVV